MTTRIELNVHCTPVGQPRPRATVRVGRGGKPVAGIYHPDSPGKSEKARKRNAPFMAALAFGQQIRDALWRAGRPAEPWTGPISLTIEAFFERPQYLLKKKHPNGPIRCTAKPDRDNLDKVVMDALTEAGLWKDDAQVCDGSTRKWYVARGCAPGVRILIERISEEGDLPFPSQPNA